MRHGIPAKIDSTVYRSTFYGVLNVDGGFWTPLAYPTPEAAEQAVAAFWLTPEKTAAFKHTIVPVRIILEELEPTDA